jgi:hypothetical protein
MSAASYFKLSLPNCALPFVMLAFSSVSFAQIAVTTHHYDNRRSGWNSQETILNPANVNVLTFGLLHTIALDEQVDAQPLIMPNVEINGVPHHIVFVATEGNTVYGISTLSGQILLQRNFGPPVSFPVGCNNTPNTGINSTPVIDQVANIMYVMVYTQTANGPQYFLHALALGTLADTVPPRQVAASHTLSDGSTFAFNATVQRQRPALLLANGNVYAGFGGFCDLKANQSRGWLLGWQAGTLQPLAANQVFDTEATSPDSYFLSSIWMSGAGLAADDSGDILFTTGNSDPTGITWNYPMNLSESAVKVSPDVSSVLDFYTPDNQPALDAIDGDFSAGGIMLLPDQRGSIPHLAVAAGKDGNMYLMNEDSLGGHSTASNNVLGTYPIGGCWCGESYFQDPRDGKMRVVSSGGQSVKVWKLSTSPSPSASLVTSSVALGVPVKMFAPQGSFTSVSSNGTRFPIIWSLSQGTSYFPIGAPAPPASDSAIYLRAFDPETGSNTVTMNQLFQAQVGQWIITGMPNLIPVVAAGKVFVGGLKQLSIFGLLPQ